MVRRYDTKHVSRGQGGLLTMIYSSGDCLFNANLSGSSLSFAKVELTFAFLIRAYSKAFLVNGRRGGT